MGCFVMKRETTKQLPLLEDRTTGPGVSKPVLFLLEVDNDIVFSFKGRNGRHPWYPRMTASENKALEENLEMANTKCIQVKSYGS